MTYNPKKENATIGRITSVSTVTPYEAKQEALLMVRKGRYKPGTKLDKVIKLLSTGGVFLEEQVIELTGAKKRTLQTYRKKSYIDLLPAPLKLSELISKPRVYALGPVGLALAELQNELVPTGYLKTSHDRVTHDVLCNMVYYQIYQAAKQIGYVAILKGKYEATIHNKKGQPILEPDSMVILKKGEEEHSFLIEYHNENYSSRAGEKIRKYEHIYKEGYWRQWHVETFPPILIATTHRAPAMGYNEEIKKHLKGEGLRCTYLIKPLRALLDGSKSPLMWLNLEKNRKVNLLKI
ncbi:MAG: replication-relaxation family protein [Ardenticatenaceae bacterium]